MSERIITSIVDHVATVTLNRADKRNAIDMAMFKALIETAESLAGEHTVRAIVLHGDGPDFCAGIDVSVFQGAGIGVSVRELLARRDGAAANFVQHAVLAWRELPVPVIAAIRGSTIGGGLQIAMGADMRYAAADTHMSIMEIRWGLIPDMGITTTLRHVVAQDKVRELAYTGRLVSAEEALNLGLVTEVVDDPLAKAMATAAVIAQQSPDAIRAIKRLINESWDDDPGNSLLREAELQLAVLAGDNQREAALASMENRPPNFRDPMS